MSNLFIFSKKKNNILLKIIKSILFNLIFEIFFSLKKEKQRFFGL